MMNQMDLLNNTIDTRFRLQEEEVVAGLTEVVTAAVLDLKNTDLSALQTALTTLTKDHEQASIRAVTSQEELRVAISVAQVEQEAATAAAQLSALSQLNDTLLGVIDSGVVTLGARIHEVNESLALATAAVDSDLRQALAALASLVEAQGELHQSDLLALSALTAANITAIDLSLHAINDALEALNEVVTHTDTGLARQASDTVLALAEHSHALSILANDTDAALFSLHAASHAHAVSLDLHNQTMAIIVDHTIPALVDTALVSVHTTMSELTNNVSSAIARR